MAQPLERPQRPCDVCHQTDDHPRHVQPRRGQEPLIRHMDCCAAQGCETCQATETATRGARGPDLLAAIQGGALDGINV